MIRFLVINLSDQAVDYISVMDVGCPQGEDDSHWKGVVSIFDGINELVFFGVVKNLAEAY